MLTALVGVVGLVVVALLSWVFEGGAKRGERRTIREEVELANLLGADTPHGRQLLRSAHEHIDLYTGAKRQFRYPARRSVIAVAVFTVVGGNLLLLNVLNQQHTLDDAHTAATVGKMLLATGLCLLYVALFARVINRWISHR